jgi:hypothetical protein
MAKRGSEEAGGQHGVEAIQEGGADQIDGLFVKFVREAV